MSSRRLGRRKNVTLNCFVRRSSNFGFFRILVQQSLRYRHTTQKYIGSLDEGVIPINYHDEFDSLQTKQKNRTETVKKKEKKMNWEFRNLLSTM